MSESDVESVRALVKQRIDVNAALGDGATALHWAVHQNDQRMVDLLIESGARVDTANDLGVTPLYLACGNRSATTLAPAFFSLASTPRKYSAFLPATSIASKPMTPCTSTIG